MSGHTTDLFLCGDVMTGRGIDQILPFSSDPVLYESYVKNAEQYVKLARQYSGPIPGDPGFDYIWRDALTKLKRFRLNRAPPHDIEWLAGQLNRECRNFDTSICQTDDGRMKLKWKMEP